MSFQIRSKRLGALCAVGALTAAGLAVSATPANADSFEANNIPSVSVPNDAVAFTLAAGAGSTTKVIPVTVTDLDGIDDITTVRACLYQTGGDSTCASPDPQTDMAMLFTNTEATTTQAGSFGLVTSSPVNANWANDTSVLNVAFDPLATSMVMNFRIRPSAVAAVGAWNLRVVATDKQAATGQYNPGNADWTPAMPYYSAIASGRTSQSYGAVSRNATGLAQNVATGNLTTNATSVVNFAAGNFTGTGTALTNANQALVATAPTAGQYALACNAGATYGLGTPVSVQSTTTSTLTGQATAGTIEAGAAAAVNSCRLTNGGADAAGTYTGTVTLTVTQ